MWKMKVSGARKWNQNDKIFQINGIFTEMTFVPTLKDTQNYQQNVGDCGVDNDNR